MHLESSNLASLPDGSQAITFTIILPKVIDSALHFEKAQNPMDNAEKRIALFLYRAIIIETILNIQL